VHHVAVHGPNSAGTGSSSVEGQTDAHADLGAGFHVYRVDWTKGSLTFSLDGAVVRTVTPSSLPKRTSWVFDHPFDLILDLAVGGTWPGDPDASTTWPQTMTVDYVRVSR
jgi:beta-glucanase (GH16 family)